MNSSEVFDLIEKIAATSSKLSKIELVKEGMADPMFAQVMKAAYDPFKVYGIAAKTLEAIAATTSTPSEGDGGFKFDDVTWTILDELNAGTLSGNEAVSNIAAEISRLDLSSAILFKRILLKDLRAGFSESTINKAAPGTIPEFPYMRCSLPAKSNMDKWDWSKGIFSQEKADGMFLNVSVSNAGFVTVTSRQGTPFKNEVLGGLAEQFAAVLKHGTQTHGEAVVFQDGKPMLREDSNGVMNHLADGGSLESNQIVRFFAWDQIPLAAVKPKGKVSTPYARRFADLKQQLSGRLTAPPGVPLNVELIPTRIVKSKAEAIAHFSELLKLDKEGTICKNPAAEWKDGTSKDQVKLKLEFEVDLEITGFEPGEGKWAEYFGSLQTKSSCGQLQVNVSGFKDAKRIEIHNNRDHYLGSIITVRANDIMYPDDGAVSLFLPRFVEERRDKGKADDLDRVIAQRQAAVEAV